MNAKVVAVRGNLITAETDGDVIQNGIAHCVRSDGARLLCEVIRIRGKQVDIQAFEETRGIKLGDAVEFDEQMLSVELGPGMLGEVFDGLQNRLHDLAEESWFLEAGKSSPGLDRDKPWPFTPIVAEGDEIQAASKVGTVPEGPHTHEIMTPFDLDGTWTVSTIKPAGEYTVEEEVARVTNADGEERSVKMMQTWPVKRALSVIRKRMLPTEPLVTGVRIIDGFFPVVAGGTYCVPGPFGAGKTVLQHLTAKYARVDVVVLAACGERAGEVVETLKEFPELEDPRTGRPLMERTITICNTSAMPVAAREASVYTAVTMAEYYRQMGLNVLLLADSTSRWAQAMRELSGRLEEIPGDEAYPAYLESRIAGFYERAGAVELPDGRNASVTIGGTVSPAGGNFEEPVTQGTLKVVGAFHGLSRARSDARRYPAIDPIDSWSRYPGIIDAAKIDRGRQVLRRGHEVKQMLTVVGEEGTPIDDFVTMLKAEFIDSVFLQQNAFDAVDAATPPERQRVAYDLLLKVLDVDLTHRSKPAARSWMMQITDLLRNWNYQAEDSDGYQDHLKRFDDTIAEVEAEAREKAEAKAATAGEQA